MYWLKLQPETVLAGELLDLLDEISHGRIQFVFVEVKDANAGLPNIALIAWYGEGVPEDACGLFIQGLDQAYRCYFSQGYHIQASTPTDQDLTPDSSTQPSARLCPRRRSAASTSALLFCEIRTSPHPNLYPCSES
jgi:hypothetical protein